MIEMIIKKKCLQVLDLAKIEIKYYTKNSSLYKAN